jgi:hypothetical protein
VSLQQIGFIETAQMTARWVLKYHEQARDGVLKLRDLDGEGEAVDLPILKEWRSAKALLSRLRASAAPFFQGVAPDIGKAWIEVVPPLSGTPWTNETGDYADQHVRTRTCLVPSPNALSYSGVASAVLLVGIVTTVDHRLMCSEVNHGEYARTHLIVDVKIPSAPDAEA